MSFLEFREEKESLPQSRKSEARPLGRKSPSIILSAEAIVVIFLRSRRCPGLFSYRYLAISFLSKLYLPLLKVEW